MASRKKALITGITGQDGAYLAKFLLGKRYEVHGLIRRSSLPSTGRLEALLGHEGFRFLKLHYGDLSDAGGLMRLVEEIQPDELYNLGAQSHVAVSFETPEFTANVDGLGALRLLEAIRVLGFKHTKFYQASTSELFGMVQEIPQKETTPFYPRSPYAAAKLYAYWVTVNYREAYKLFACNGILFNHESPWRGETFVTRKITLGLARIACGLQDCLYLGNLDAKRDWGHARDYVEMQWLMLQQTVAEDFVISTGTQHSVREFVVLAAKEIGLEIEWKGRGISEVGVNTKTGRIILAIDPKLIRPSEVDTLLGDSSKAYLKLGWTPKTSFEELVREMALEDFAKVSVTAASYANHKNMNVVS